MMSGGVMSRHPTPSWLDSDHGAVGMPWPWTADRDFRFSPRPNRAAEIRWRPWGEPAFAEARRLGRPVLLSLSAVWCHWCHVMDETSYSDPRVIAAVNEHFVPIRVDNDRHPDVNRRYNMGGWPTTAFLAASGDVLTGGTYLPPDQMLESLARVKAFFDANQAQILALAGERASDGGRRRDGPAHRPAAGQPSWRWTALEGDPDVPGRHLRPRSRSRSCAGSTRCTAAWARSPSSRSPTCSASCSPTGCCGAPATRSTCPTAAARSCGRRACTRWCARRSRPWRAAGCTTTSRAASSATPRSATGACRTTRRCWRTTRGWPGCTWRPRCTPRDARPRRPGAVPAGGEGAVDYLLATLWRDDVPAFGGSQDADETYYALGRRRAGGPAGAVRRSDRLRGLERAGGAGPPPGGVGARAPGAGRPRPAAARPPVRDGAPRRRHGALRARGRRGRRRRAAARRPGGRGRGAARRLRSHRRAALAAPRGEPHADWVARALLRARRPPRGPRGHARRERRPAGAAGAGDRRERGRGGGPAAAGGVHRR